ncbi:MAG: hypothetical protein K6G80_05110 [Treponema sp.]|nr:hypothetical protein [Treponema sp.]
MILCPAQSFDLPAIMTIEHSAFIPQIQEKKRVFNDRLQLFPQGFLILADTSEDVVFKHGASLTAGYLTSEIWATAPDFEKAATEAKAQKALSQQFALGHAMYKSHCITGSALYISSYALLPAYRGSGLGLPFFHSAVSALCGAFAQIRTVILLVCEEWTGARHIYEKLGFTPVYTLPGFFPSLHKKAADGIIMQAAAEQFRSAPLARNQNGAILVQPAAKGVYQA